MNKAAIYHRPESEYAFLYTKDELRLRLRTALDDIEKVEVIYGDPYEWLGGVWKSKCAEMKKTLATDTHQYWTSSVNAPYNRLNYGFILTDTAGVQIFYGDQGVEDVVATSETESSGLMGSKNYFKMPYFQEIDRFKPVEWVKETVWYQIFPERFANGESANDNENTKQWNPDDHPEREDFYGGDLRGIIDHLDYLEELGINGLYLCPIFEAPSNHKYDTMDYKKIDRHFGTDKDFKELVEKAHARGIRVMLDAVFNHIGDKSPQWQDVVQNGKNSKYVDWFHIHEFPVGYKPLDEHNDDSTYETFAFTHRMPKLNTANPEVQRYLLDIATYWIREFDIDAWRLDVANEVDHHFWKLFKTACEKEKEDFYIVGEIWTSAQSWLNGDEFTAVMNYAFTGAIVDYFAKGKITLEKMVSNLNTQLMLNRDQTNQMMFNLLDSHDAPRVLTLAKEDKDVLKQMFAFLFLQCGTPDIYYGTEVGMIGEDDPDNRKPMEWREEKQDVDLFAFFKKLIAFRKENSQLLSEGELHWSVVDEEKGIIQLIRTLGESKMIGTFNTGEEVVKGEFGEIILTNLAAHVDSKVEIAPKGFVLSVS
ncbi:Glycosidase [Pilibacter termitis]|uniref:Glycosidase n=1 Tax=Pilibacter termitis TaxID=263852 RepID=A0A1T4MDU6_9ENTE|nr:glycoside hydrolase family 13 protein [Pilibacter termitis]SJZ65027.1 Glycosidase [Pilibacter termitis]